MSKSLRSRVLEAVAPAGESGRDRDEEEDVTSAKVTSRDSAGDESDPEEGAAPSAIRARSAPSLRALGERYVGKKTSRRSLREARGDLDEREHGQAEWRDMLEVSEDEEDAELEEKGDSEFLEEKEIDDDQSEDDGEDLYDEEEGEKVRASVMADALVEDEVEKGRAIKSQLQVWEKLLEARIQLQKVVTRANRLPQPGTFAAFAKAGDEEHGRSCKKAQAALVNLLDDILEVKAAMVSSNKELRSAQKRAVADEGVDGGESSSPPPKRQRIKWYGNHLSASGEEMRPYRNATIQRWNDKTRLSSGGKSFSAFESHTSTLKQIEFILSDRTRLVARTQSKRSDYRTLGKAEDDESDSLDPEIFDDDDFYHQLLRELIDRKGEEGALGEGQGRHWLHIQKMRSKAKKGAVDARASKGRKTRYDIHSKLVNFMAPASLSEWWRDEARNELFSSLFGKCSVGGGGGDGGEGGDEGDDEGLEKMTSAVTVEKS